MNRKQVNLPAGTVSYIDEGRGEAILLLHGFCGSSEYWEKVIPVLSGNYRVIAPDLPGHGESGQLAEGYSIETIADHMKSFLQKLELDNVIMFGHSLGGYITLSFARKYVEGLNGFSLIHSTAHPDSEEAKKARVANVEKVEKEGMQALIDGLVPKLFSPDNLESNARDIQRAKEIGYKTSREGAAGALLAMKDRPDLNRVLEETSLPVLLVAGEKDQIVPSEKTFSISKENIMQEVIPDTGHMGMYENPDELVRVMKKFLEG
ncbi:alpha/beta hydrolase [Mesobacillus campisalis]|uniref:Alpha/beta hydrolase n=1 Tax=Mesobacillus campisalis TaxID=1408103 RepID=A0A0M2STJ0_9BACI|nr:alpha/beta hydrolase [Mesobacillus campisalis]KKK37889.1 alpha/beta hydrolase [Mesobacillus campisalis]